MGFVYLILLLGIELFSIAKANKNCQDKKAVITLNKDVLKCSIEGFEYVHNMMVEYRLYAEEEPQHLAAISYTNAVENARFSTEHLKEGLSEKKVYCSYHYKPTNTLMPTCNEVRSNNSINFGFICPMIPPESEVNQFQELTLKLNNPPDLYCIRNQTSCPITARIEFFNNTKLCRSRTPQRTSTSALMVYDSCTNEFTADNWKSGVVFKVLKNTNFFISNNIGKDQAVFLDFYYDAEKKHKHINCIKPTIINLKPVEEEMSKCESVADPHIKTFDKTMLLLESFYSRGGSRHTEKVAENISEMSIYWKVVENVNAEDMAEAKAYLRINRYGANDGILEEEDYIGKLLVPRDDFRKKLIKGTRITKLNEKEYEVLLPNGDSVKVKLEDTGFSLTVSISSLPSNYKQVKGFCAIKKNENAQDAMKTFLIEEKDSNFKGTKESSTKQSSTQNVCLCESGRETCMETLSYVGCNEAVN
ncbi:uncharacterized protein LOC131944181 [Physella acuta]|uniref:uncharacterized protein LOC131944181 n=1 Tax=Physella acuta TaxID=109671 RepID=UPI0027DE1922|nr:uncharacterized protein LOC131944181 [Physella acuta]